MAQRDSSPVYYREIQRTSYLKRIPEEQNGSKLLPLGLKKNPPKPLWTQLCIHNGRTPYLEQYRDPVSSRAHRPIWRRCLATARHVTASVSGRDTECDFQVDTDEGAVRLLAPDWQCMNDWVCALRTTLVDLHVLPPRENVYVPAPAPAPARAPARDPTSPLPPLPAPPHRVPGIELTPSTRQTDPVPTDPIPVDPVPTDPIPTDHIPTDPCPTRSFPNSPVPTDPDWETPTTSVPKTRLAKICGQSICLDDSILTRRDDDDDDEDCDDTSSEYKQTVVVGESGEGDSSDRTTNVTVIQVSNKDSTHTQTPTDTHVFNFDNTSKSEFVNIVNTENGSSSEYGTIFDNDYGHLSLTTTVNLTGDVNVTGRVQTVDGVTTDVKRSEDKVSNGARTKSEVRVTGDNKTDVKVTDKSEDLYERLCMASTELKAESVARKSSLPNLNKNTGNSTYEYLYLSENNNVAITSNSSNVQHNNSFSSSGKNEISVTATSNQTSLTTITAPCTSNQTPVSTNSTPASSKVLNTASVPSTSSNLTPVTSNMAPVTSNMAPVATNMAPVTSNMAPVNSNISINGNINGNTRVNISSVAVSNMDSNVRSIRANIERSLSQNSCDSPKREVKRDGVKSKVEPAKPIWKRGLTELSLLTRLRGIGPSKRSDSPNRNGNDRNDANSSSKIVHRSRPEARIEQRRRSSSLSNGDTVPAAPATSLVTLRARQAQSLRAEQRRGAALVAKLSAAHPPVFAEYRDRVWVCAWGGGCAGGRAGDCVVGAGGVTVTRLAQLHHTLQTLHTVDILYHRVPLAKIFLINKRDKEPLGIKLDSECNIVCVCGESAAARAGVQPGPWAVTEVNNRSVLASKNSEEEMNRASHRGTETLLIVHPAQLVRAMRVALKRTKGIKHYT